MPPVERTDAHEESFGPVFAIFIIVTLLILGALFIVRKAVPENPFPRRDLAPKDPVVELFSVQSPSVEFFDIRRDLAATSIRAIERDLAPLE